MEEVIGIIYYGDEGRWAIQYVGGVEVPASEEEARRVLAVIREKERENGLDPDLSPVFVHRIYRLPPRKAV